MRLDTIPRVKFAHLPTAVEFMPRLSTYLGGPRLFVKRDDQTGLASGGNKTRKLEFLIAEALHSGARTLVTAGATQSNHCRQTAAVAAHYGLDCILVLSGSKPQARTGNLLLDQMFGAEIVWAEGNQRDLILQRVFREAEQNGRFPYLIPYGGSSPTGAAGYVYAIHELMEQWQLIASQPDWIVFASSSGGTHAGLVVGSRLYGYSGRVLGISIDETAQILKDRVAKLSTATAHHLGIDLEFNAMDILVNADYLGAGYGMVGESEREAIKLFARLEGLLLDPVYTGRAAGGMLDLIHKGYFKQDEAVLFWHTGGLPALFADRYADMYHD
ncbi:MAG: pyridoxal-5'-phosphate-dependent protein [Chloroflexi bacterium RBG_16_52_11]|nr:MAG: pyridoxal-5'-phosphate-dependent protein [Chloroflexi bacterium RBG_16_52_11]